MSRLPNIGLQVHAQENCSAVKQYLFWGREVIRDVSAEGQAGNRRVQLISIAVSDVSE